MNRGRQQVLCKAGRNPRPAPVPSARVSLAPRVPPSLAPDSTTFHRALSAWNALLGAALTWDELSIYEQSEVRRICARLDREAHPCRKPDFSLST